MGLDMFLNKRTYVKNWPHTLPENSFDVTVKKNGEEFKPIKKERVSYIVENIAQWYYCNHIHMWLVNNYCETANDEFVPKEVIRELVDVCKTVKESLDKSEKGLVKNVLVYVNTEIAEDLLPLDYGMEYDEKYYKSLVYTIESIEPELDENDDTSFYYHSSW